MRSKFIRIVVGAIALAGALSVARPVMAAGEWYYCTSARAYYPYVQRCPEPWRVVAPSASVAGQQGVQAQAAPTLPIPTATGQPQSLFPTAIPTSNEDTPSSDLKPAGNCRAPNGGTVDLSIDTCLTIGGTPRTGIVPCRTQNGASVQIDVVVCQAVGGKIDRSSYKSKSDDSSPSLPTAIQTATTSDQHQPVAPGGQNPVTIPPIATTSIAQLPPYQEKTDETHEYEDSEHHNTENSDVSYAVIFILILVAIYFLPTIIAINRRHQSAGSIAVLNILLGWTFIGWLVSIVWSLSATTRQKINEARKIAIATSDVMRGD